MMLRNPITSAQAFAVALLGMAVAEILGRTLVMVTRRSQLQDGTQHLALA